MQLDGGKQPPGKTATATIATTKAQTNTNMKFLKFIEKEISFDYVAP